MPPGDSQVIIVGGGISGLAAAHALGKAGVQSVLIEARPRLGGVIETRHIQGCIVEGGPDSFLAAKPQATALAKELGLGGELIGSNDEGRITYIRRGDRMIPMPDGLMMMIPTKVMPLVRTPLLGLGTKVRMGLDYFRRPASKPQPDRSVAEFIRDHYGDDAVDYLAEPLLAGVYGGDPKDLSVNSVLARFVDLENKYGSLTRGVLATLPARDSDKPAAPLFQTLRGGLGSLVEALERTIAQHTAVRQSTAETVERTAEGWRVKAGGDWIAAPHVILATPAHASAHLVERISPEAAKLLGRIAYRSSMTVAFGYRKADIASLLPGFGFLVPKKERKRLFACTFVHNKFSNRAPAGIALLRCSLMGEDREDDNALMTIAREELRDMLSIAATPIFSSLSRWPRSMAQYNVGHADRLQQIGREIALLPGLHLAGNALSGIGIPDCIQAGQTAAQRILNSRVP